MDDSLINLADSDIKALLDKASKYTYKKSITKSVDSDEVSECKNNDALHSTGQLSKEAQKIFEDLKRKADLDTFREDEAVDTRFDQKKLGKSASHESCHPKSRAAHSRHSTHGGVDVDALIGSCIFDSNKDEFRRSNSAYGKTNFRSTSSRGATTPSMDYSRCGCRSPGARVGHEIQHQRGLNRSYSGTGGTGYWAPSIQEGDDITGITGTVDWSQTDPDNTELHRIAKANLSDTDGMRDEEYRNRSAGLVEMDIFRRQFDKSFSSATPFTGRLHSGAKRRSNSQRGHSHRRHHDETRSPKGESADESDRMSRSDLGFLSGRSPPRVKSRKKKIQQEDVRLSHQVNGYQGYGDLDDIMVYINGPDANKKLQSEQQQAKKTKKKSMPENNGNGTVANTSIGGNTKKEKIRRLTEGDDGKVKSVGGTLNYKHRSTDSLELTYKEDDAVPFAATGRATSLDDSADKARFSTGIISLSSRTVCDSSVRPSDTESEMAKHSEVEKLKEPVICANIDLMSTLTVNVGDDEQFIPVTNKKKKNKSEQFRSSTSAVTPRYGRSMKNKAYSDVSEHAKRSVTPPARDTAMRRGRRRRNSLDDPRVASGDITRTSESKEVGAVISTNDLINVSSTSDTSSTKVPDNESPNSNKPSYARVAAAHPQATIDSNPRSNRGKFTKKHTRHYAGSKDDHTMKEDTSGTNTRQASSLNASRSSSPVNIPTAVATNLVNASSPDLKHFTGEIMSYSKVAAQAPKRTYATIAAEKRSTTLDSTAKTSGIQPMDTIGAEKSNIKVDTDPSMRIAEEADNSGLDVSTTDTTVRKTVTDMAVNTEPILTNDVPTMNLGENAFTFEMKASSSEVKGVVKKTIERTSCSGVFNVPDRRSDGQSCNPNEGGNSKFPTSNYANRERRNSCPVQFLDKGGAAIDVRSLNASGLNFVYGDEEDSEEISAALARSATIDLPEPVNRTVEVNTQKVDHPSMTPGNNDRISNTPIISWVPDRMVRAMADYVHKAWKEFTRDGTSMIYYNSASK